MDPNRAAYTHCIYEKRISSKLQNIISHFDAFKLEKSFFTDADTVRLVQFIASFQG